MLQSANHDTYIYKAAISLMWKHSSDFISAVKGSTARVARAGKLGRFRDRPGEESDIWLTARLLTNEPVEDVRHRLETVKSLSATSK